MAELCVCLAALAQAGVTPASAEALDRSAMETRQFLSLTRQFMSECDNAAWSLWWSNDYEKWRKNRRGILSINYHSRAMEKTPPAPKTIEPDLARQIEEQIAKANAVVKGAQVEFGLLANYINAKDYEDDKFQKGDTLNAKLAEAGKSCFAISKAIAPLYAKAQEKRAGMPEPTPIRQAILEDYDRARALEAALAKGAGNADEIGRAVTELSQAIEQRQTSFASELAARSTPSGTFYRVINEDVAVPMRRLLRERSAGSKNWAEAFVERPRSAVEQIRNTILRSVTENYANAMTQQ